MEHFITNIHINEVRHLKNIEIKLNPEKRQHLILTGKNGSGKTSVLQAMRNYLKAINNGMLNTIHVDWPRTIELAKRNYENATSKAEKIQAQSAIKSFESSIAEYNGQLSIQLSDEVELDSLYKQGDFITAYFPADRSTVIYRANGVKDVKLEDTYGLDSTPINILLQYMVHLKTQQAYAKNENDLSVEKKITEWFTRFESALKVLLSDDSIRLVYDYKNYNFLIEQKGRNPYSLD